MFLTLGVTLLASTTEIQLVLYYACTVYARLCSDKPSMYLRTTLFLFTDLYMHLISPPVESNDIAG